MYPLATPRKTFRYGLTGLIAILVSLGIVPALHAASTVFGPSQTLATGIGGSPPSVAAVGDVIYVVWQQGSQILLRRSVDGGVSFPEQPQVISNDSGVGPVVAAAGPHVYVAWLGFTGTADAIFLKYSSDGGVTFDEPPVQLAVVASSDTFFFDLALTAVDEAVYVVWVEETQTSDTTSSELLFTRRLQPTEPFAPVSPLASGQLEGSNPILDPSIAATSTDVYVVWHQQTSTPSVDVRFLESTDRGENFLPVRTLQSRSDRFVFYDPAVAAVDQQVYVAWVNTVKVGQFFTPQVFVVHSADKGASFGTPIKPGANQSGARPSVAASATQVVVSWTGGRQGSGGQLSNDILVAQSRDQGATFTAEMNLSDNAGSSTSPALAVVGENVAVAWRDTTSGSLEILFRGGRPRPVVILPGLMGSELANSNGEVIWINATTVAGNGNDLFLNELLLDASGQSIGAITATRLMRGGPSMLFPEKTNVYDDFINFLITNGGYTEKTEAGNGTLFPCPYDWRLDVQGLTTTLQACIDAALTANPDSDKVDIVGHSTGGLVARAYVAQFGADKVNKIVYIATPHQGSPRAFNALAYDDGMIRNFVDFSSFGFEIVNNQTLSAVVTDHCIKKLSSRSVTF